MYIQKENDVLEFQGGASKKNQQSKENFYSANQEAESFERVPHWILVDARVVYVEHGHRV